MNLDLIKSESEFSFHLDGESEIEASLLSETIKSMAELTKLVAREENPEAYLKMNVTAFSNGSFQINFSAVCEFFNSLFEQASPVVALAGSIIAAVKGCFEIKKHLDGKEAKNVKTNEDKIEITNDNGSVLTAPKSSQIVINNVTVDNLVTNIANNVHEHNPNGGFTFLTESGKFDCGSEDVSKIAKSLPIKEISICQRQTIDTQLVIGKAVLVGISQWGFIYNGHSINASIEDEDFINSFQSKGSVKAGDYINATLEICVDLDAQGLPIQGSKKYKVVKVKGEIHHSYDESDNVSFYDD